MTATAPALETPAPALEPPPQAEQTRVSLESYLNTDYSPDVDWLDGELKERNMGEAPHASIQVFLAYLFRTNAQHWGVRVLIEQRIQTSATNYRVADVCVVRASTGPEPIVRTAPLLCVEIVSRGDTMSEMQHRVEDYLSMGVDTVWIIDPRRRKAYQSSIDGALGPAPVQLTVPDTEIMIPVGNIFAELDWMQPAK